MSLNENLSSAAQSIQLCHMKANLHWEVARSSRARFFVCFIAARSSHAESCISAELPDATKQPKDYTWQLLARPQCRLALSVEGI